MAELAQVVVGWCAAAALLAGCTSVPTVSATSPPAENGPYGELVDGQIAEAQAAGADTAQLALLERARQAGVMSHELAMEAARSFMQCLTDVGIRAELVPSDDTGDFPQIQYRIYTEDLTVADQCDIKTYDFVDTVYQLQPAANAHKADVLAKHAQDFRQCLEDAGIEIPADADDRTLPGAVIGALDGLDPYGAAMLPDGPVDCLSPFGLTQDDLLGND